MEEKCLTYDVKADGLNDLLVTTEDELIQFSPARSTQQIFLLVRRDLGLADFPDDGMGGGRLVRVRVSVILFVWRVYEPVRPNDMESHLRESKLIVAHICCRRDVVGDTREITLRKWDIWLLSIS